ncbi:NtaA/DmoA family FMN-dependent monooxygenase [Cellulomonas humilata]|uniref:NtaA/DmoA family FMN-dependent monooxygenase n=1 Tax=Cellulomonas humilata TaxID=144055 RepID=A0A7Y6DWZ2_9CELL|nr:NtaA/DmoA family FMN-dependent monooxygenase [Cellulomonas humilata]NUU16404.1 NtaA/DmoA family FMN-dependent monooxygenase [Cellulomonas humilata]
MAPRHLRLGVHHTVVGQHAGAWRISTQPTDSESLGQHLAAARVAQDAGLDFLLLTDVLGEQGDPVSPGFHPRLEPAVLLGALAASTSSIGLVGSFSTTFQEPYALARQLSSLDHVSGGRAGWNIVTSFRPGLPGLPPHAERYARAHEVVTTAAQLWDAWEPDALVRDRRTGAVVDPSRVHRVQHERGVLPASRSPQGRPVLFQAGASEDGLALAARCADVVLTSQDHLPDARAHYAELKARVADAGRDPDDVLVVPGVMVLVGSSRAQAQDVHARLTEVLDDDAARRRLSAILGWDTSALPFDAPVEPAPAMTEGHRSRAALLHRRATRENLSVGELARVAEATRGHRLVVGTAQDVADELIGWFEDGAADGFLVGPAVMPSGLRRFARDVVPLLARHRPPGRTGGTLRERLGLPLGPRTPAGPQR